MYREREYKENLLSLNKKSQQLYVIKEFAQSGEKNILKPKRTEHIIGLENALKRAEILTNEALNGRKISVIERKKLKEELYLDLRGWNISIKKV